MNLLHNADNPTTIEVSDQTLLCAAPLVSVLMITYNHEDYIAEAIEGVLAQKTDFPIELLIGEDCSTDGTPDIVEDYRRRHPHLIRVITSKYNVGVLRNL